MDHLLFHGDQDLRTYMGTRKDQLRAEVESADPDYLLTVSEADYGGYLRDKYGLSAPEILVDRIYQHEPKDINIDVSRDPMRRAFGRGGPASVKGTSVTISLPFEGDGDLFRYQPSSYNLSPPRGRVVKQEVRLTYEFTGHEADALSHRYDRDLGGIQAYLSWVRGDVSGFNDALPQFARQVIARRRKKLMADRRVSAALGIPIKRRADAPHTYTVPDVRRKPRIRRPQVLTEAPFQPEPALEIAEYMHILKIIKDMVQVMERSPKAFAEISEEVLRHHFLVPLNGHYEGQAVSSQQLGAA